MAKRYDSPTLSSGVTDATGRDLARVDVEDRTREFIEQASRDQLEKERVVAAVANICAIVKNDNMSPGERDWLVHPGHSVSSIVDPARALDGAWGGVANEFLREQFADKLQSIVRNIKK